MQIFSQVSRPDVGQIGNLRAVWHSPFSGHLSAQSQPASSENVFRVLSVSIRVHP